MAHLPPPKHNAVPPQKVSVAPRAESSERRLRALIAVHLWGNPMRSFSCLLFFVVLASSASATVIPADALIDFQVDALAPVGNGPYSTHVAAWRNTGLFLSLGDIFALTATGIAAESPAGMAGGGRTPDGDGGACGGCIADIPNSRYALVGKIGTDLGDEFFVGSSFLDVANDTGLLYLGFNDNNYNDNLGFFTVSTAPVPEPSTALLLSMGLLGLGLHAGRKRSSSL